MWPEFEFFRIIFENRDEQFLSFEELNKNFHSAMDLLDNISDIGWSSRVLSFDNETELAKAELTLTENGIVGWFEME